MGELSIRRSASALASNPDIIYVDGENATYELDDIKADDIVRETSWQEPYKYLQSAINDSVKNPGRKILVKYGTYFPTAVMTYNTSRNTTAMTYYNYIGTTSTLASSARFNFINCNVYCGCSGKEWDETEIAYDNEGNTQFRTILSGNKYFQKTEILENNSDSKKIGHSIKKEHIIDGVYDAINCIANIQTNGIIHNAWFMFGKQAFINEGITYNCRVDQMIIDSKCSASNPNVGVICAVNTDRSKFIGKNYGLIVEHVSTLYPEYNNNRYQIIANQTNYNCVARYCDTSNGGYGSGIFDFCESYNCIVEWCYCFQKYYTTIGFSSSIKSVNCIVRYSINDGSGVSSLIGFSGFTENCMVYGCGCRYGGVIGGDATYWNVECKAENDNFIAFNNYACLTRLYAGGPCNLYNSAFFNNISPYEGLVYYHSTMKEEDVFSINNYFINNKMVNGEDVKTVYYFLSKNFVKTCLTKEITLISNKFDNSTTQIIDYTDYDNLTERDNSEIEDLTQLEILSFIGMPTTNTDGSHSGTLPTRDSDEIYWDEDKIKELDDYAERILKNNNCPLKKIFDYVDLNYGENSEEYPAYKTDFYDNARPDIPNPVTIGPIEN